MSDDQAEQLEQPALIGVAEVLAEHAKATTRAAFDRWFAAHPAGWLCAYTHQGKALQGYEAGWRAALEWYIGLGLERNLLDVIEQAYQEGRASTRPWT